MMPFALTITHGTYIYSPLLPVTKSKRCLPTNTIGIFNIGCHSLKYHHIQTQTMKNDVVTKEPSDIAILLIRHYFNNLNPQEKAFLDNWAGEHPSNRELLENTGHSSWVSEHYKAFLAIDNQTAWSTFVPKIPGEQPLND